MDVNLLLNGCKLKAKSGKFWKILYEEIIQRKFPGDWG